MPKKAMESIHSRMVAFLQLIIFVIVIIFLSCHFLIFRFVIFRLCWSDYYFFP